MQKNKSLAKRLLSILLAICVFMMPMTAFAEGSENDNGKIKITCQSNAVTGGDIFYKLDGAEGFTKVNIIDCKPLKREHSTKQPYTTKSATAEKQ